MCDFSCCGRRKQENRGPNLSQIQVPYVGDKQVKNGGFFIKYDVFLKHFHTFYFVPSTRLLDEQLYVSLYPLIFEDFEDT